MKHTLKELLKRAKRYLRKNWVYLLVVFPLGIDMGHYFTALKAYDAEPEVKLYRQLSETLASAEENRSVSRVEMTVLLERVSPSGMVYVVKEGAQNYALLAKEGNATLVTEHIPSMSATTTLSAKLLEKGVPYLWVEEPAKPEPFVARLFSRGALSLMLLAAFTYLFMHSMGVQLFERRFGVLEPDEIEGDLSDLVGYEDIKSEVRQLGEIISKQEKYEAYGIEGTFNILFSGKAGTGKSRFARYLAKELEIPMVTATGSLDEIYVGSGAKKIRALFKEAHTLAESSEKKSCLLFIDEGEKLLRARGRSSADSKWEDDTANELLAHLDGVEKEGEHNIIVILASNFHSHSLKMDPAMLRRFNKKIHFRLPNLAEREAILLHYLERVERKEADIESRYLAKVMSGMSPAMIEAVVQESALLALRSDLPVNTKMLMQAFEQSVIGRSSRALTEGEQKLREQVVTHELGHFLIEYHRAVIHCNGDRRKAKEETRILKISSESVEQMGALGFAMREEGDEMLLRSVDDLEWEIRQLYGGLAAEQMVYGKQGVSTGAANDIEKATMLLQHMINQNNVYGSAKLNYELLGMDEQRAQMLEKHAEELFNESLEIIGKYEGLLTYLSIVLLEAWSLDKEELFDAIAEYVQESVLPL